MLTSKLVQGYKFLRVLVMSLVLITIIHVPSLNDFFPSILVEITKQEKKLITILLYFPLLETNENQGNLGFN